ncbi:MAG: phenylalanine--tRNA ligase subunit beta [Alphaproteobacteria bacterium]|nr:phenylalanine--tRNA ligase subunit beta [Alphaproteobacteria bacterium]
MKLSVDVLRRFIRLSGDDDALRDLLDDCGLEVKRQDGPGRFTLELLANRGDHHAYDGVARELSGRTGEPLCYPSLAPLELGESPWPLRCETEHCLVYTATLLERVAPPAPLTAEQLAPLEAAGIHSLTAPVDATNLSNLEMGQPTHVFDADTLEGPITIRLSRAGETCLPLFHESRVALPEGTLVIADDAKILAVAGVIGCEESKTTAETTRIVLESACFDPVKVRIAGRALNISTDSSARFERGSDPARPLCGAGRVVYLLEQTGSWLRRGPTGKVGAWTDPQRTLRVSAAASSRFLEHPLSAEEIAERLSRYGFTCTPVDADQLDAQVPPWRLWDVEFVADVYEELAKSVGYNATAISLPPIDMGAKPSDAELRKVKAEEVLLGQGFYEVFTDGFHGRDLSERLGLPEGHPLREHVETQNALDRAYSLLKNNGLAQALEAVAVNLRVRNEEVRAYEWTRTFHPQAQETDAWGRPGSPARERLLLWAIASGTDRPETWAHTARPADALFMKGVVEEIGVELGLPLTLVGGGGAHGLSACLHPRRQARVLLHGEVVGILGEVHPNVVKAFKIKRARPVYLELDSEALLGAGQQPVFAEPPTLHPIFRDLAFLLPPGMQAGDLRAHILASAHAEHLDDVRITDLFLPDDSEGRAITFQLIFRNPEHAPISSEQVNASLEGLSAEVIKRFGVTQR